MVPNRSWYAPKADEPSGIVQGETPGLPMPLLRTMTVVRRDDGALVVHSAICLDEPAMKELEAWGTPAFLVLPNAWHKIDARAWKDRYPSMRVFCPRAGMKDEVAPVVNVDTETELTPSRTRRCASTCSTATARRP